MPRCAGEDQGRANTTTSTTAQTNAATCTARRRSRRQRTAANKPGSIACCRCIAIGLIIGKSFLSAMAPLRGQLPQESEDPVIDLQQGQQIAAMYVSFASVRLQGMGIDTTPMSDDDVQKIALDRARSFRDEAPTTAAQAAKIILDGVKAERWRILVGDDAHTIDERVRKTPEQAYTPEFYESYREAVGWRLG